MTKKKTPPAPKLKKHMSVLQLRPNVEEHKIINHLKKVYNKKAAATAIMQAIKEVPNLKDEILECRKLIAERTEMLNKTTHAFALVYEGFELMGLTGDKKKSIPTKRIPVDNDDDDNNDFNDDGD